MSASSPIERARAVQERLEAGLAAARDQLTPGQRWTSALGISLVLALLLFGLPTDVTVVPGAASAAPAAAVPRDDRLAVPSTRRAEDPPAPPAVIPRRTPAPPAATPSPASPASPASQASPLPLPRRDVVAVAMQGIGLPGRDDVAMAEVFAASAAFPLPVVAVGDDQDAACAEVAARDALVIAGAVLPDDLRRCLVEGGAAVLAFDQMLKGVGASPGRRLVTTRRDLAVSLLRLGRWGAASDTLPGRVGLVAGAVARPVVEAVVPELQEMGVDITEVAYVERGAGASAAVNESVRAFATAGVETVVLAAPMEVQRAWVAQQAVLLPGVRSVVAEAFDAVVDEQYPPTFDGALSHTSLREPWMARESDETEQQAACLRTWEEAATTTLRSERVPLFAWCQHVAMVGDALAAAGPDDDLVDVLTQRTFASPLTSELGPLPHGGYGPRQEAVLVWRASCGCWESREPFAGSSG